MSMKRKEEIFRIMLNDHDFLYEHSGDHENYKRGCKEEEELRKVMEGNPRFQRLYFKKKYPSCTNKPFNEDCDVLKNPSHYTQGGIEPLDYIIANNMSFLEGNVVKYVTRYKFKNGLEDLEKARVYLDKLIGETK